MKIREILRERSSGVSFEFFPPKSAERKEGFMEVVHELSRYNPLYVSVTYGAGGSSQERTLKTLEWLREETDLTVMSHLTCIGSTRSSIAALLENFREKGVDNILALRGDAPRNVPDFDVSKGEFRYARDLVEFIAGYEYFSMGVAVYPEGHFESPDIWKDMEYTKQKVDAGADFGISQMFFDNRYFYDFMDRAAKIGIHIPILPGIMPITDCRKIEEFANFCNATLPEDIRAEMSPHLDSPEYMRKIGVAYAVRQCEDLIRNGVRFLHFYTMNKADTAREIIDALPKW